MYSDMNPVDTIANSGDKLPVLPLPVPVAPSGLIKLNKFALNDAPFTRCFIQFISGRFHPFHRHEAVVFVSRVSSDESAQSTTAITATSPAERASVT